MAPLHDGNSYFHFYTNQRRHFTVHVTNYIYIVTMKRTHNADKDQASTREDKVYKHNDDSDYS